MSKISKSKGIPAFEKADEKQMVMFWKKIKKLHYKEITTEDTLREIVVKRMVAPKRADAENALQIKLKYSAGNGYYVKILLGMIGQNLINHGYAWVLILKDGIDKPIMSIPFPKGYTHSLLFRIGAYADLTRRIIDEKHTGWDLVETEHNHFVWRTPDGDRPFNILYYAGHLSSKKEVAYVRKRENATARWIKNTPGKIRRRNIRKSWPKMP